MTPLQIYGSKILAEKLEAQPFSEQFPWIGGDLQTLKNNALSSRLAPVSGHRTRHLFPAPTGKLSGVLNTPLRGQPKALVILCPGLGGTEDSSYMVEYAGAMVPKGYATLRWNLRGSGPSAATSKGPYHAGLSEDLHAVLTHLPDTVTHLPIFIIGFSLGGHLLLRTLAENNLPRPVVGGISISAPLSLSDAMQVLERPRNFLYMRYLVKKLRCDIDPDMHEATAKLRTVRDVDNAVIAPHHGFKDAEDYYEKVSVMPILDQITTPVLVLHAADDPWIPATSYRQARWPDNPQSATIVSAKGGHVGFHAAGQAQPWALELTLRYLAELTVFYG